MKKILFALLLTISSLTFAHTTIKLTEKNSFAIVGPIDMPTIFSVLGDLSRLNQMKTNAPIYLRLDSPGGRVDVAEALIFLMKRSRRKIHTVTVFAASAAFTIAQSMGRRYIAPHGLMLTHYAFMTQFRITEESEEIIKNAKLELFKIYEDAAKRMKMPFQKYLDFMKQETLIRGENTLVINAADEIVNIECSKELILAGNCSR